MNDFSKEDNHKKKIVECVKYSIENLPGGKEYVKSIKNKKKN